MRSRSVPFQKCDRLSPRQCDRLPFQKCDRIPDYTGKMAAGRQYERSRSTSRRRSGLPESSVRLSVID
ncbi:hypothetical protein ACOKW7_10470 [Limnospira platensis CENA597]|uniref:hypothetical protein n=1 Tax=Limnospira platensis TaxID=118562 RepID=UPI003D9FEC84